MLKVKFHLPGDRFPIFSQTRLPIVSKHQNRFGARDASLFVPTDLEQFAHPTAIGKGKHGERRAHQDPSIEALWLEAQLISSFCRIYEPGITRGEQPRASTGTSVGKTKLTRRLPTLLIAFLTQAIYTKFLQETMFNQIPEPQTIGSRAVKLHKKSVVLWNVCLFAQLCMTDRVIGVAVWMVKHPCRFVPKHPVHARPVICTSAMVLASRFTSGMISVC